MDKKEPKVSIVIPTLNEEANVGIVLCQLPEVHEIIIVDGHSKDDTVKIAKKFKTKIIYEDKPGKGLALIKGMKAATGDIIIMMDADCSHRVSEFGLLIEGIKSGYDVCMGSRFIQGGGTADMPFYRKIGNKMFVLMVNIFWGMNYSDLCYGYRSLRRDVIDKLDLKSTGFGIETEISIKCAKRKLKVLEIPSYEKLRESGDGKLRTFSDGWKILKTIVYELFHK